ncbi:TPA: hypothetical protein ACNP9N_004153 [Enterobacter asburiae]|uniref:hypothetical protein n=1 Tax=Enterobacter asburiae TaxID=61645 RepID=UPI003B2F42BF
MIHFHGGPITPDTCALKAWKGRHAFISFANQAESTAVELITGVAVPVANKREQAA